MMMMMIIIIIIKIVRTYLKIKSKKNGQHQVVGLYNIRTIIRCEKVI